MVEAVPQEKAFKKYLVHFRQHWKHLDFARQELESLAEMHGVTKAQLFVNDPETLDMKVNPTVYVNLPSDEVCREIASRSVLIKEIIDVFSECQLTRKSRERSRERDQVEREKVLGKATSEQQPEEKKSEEKVVAKEEVVVDPVQFNYDLLVSNTDGDRLTPHLRQEKKLKMSIEGVGRKIGMREQIAIIEMFKVFPFREKDVDLDHPELIFKIIENAADSMCYFGLIIASYKKDEKSGKGKKHETYYTRYNLKKRPYLGPTSTDHELAFLMANQAQIKPADLVYDPFVGTGSIAVAMQHFQAVVMGSDLDIRVLKGYAVGGKTKNKGIEGLDKIDKFNIFTNFLHYGIPTPEVMTMDVSVVQFNVGETADTGVSMRPIFDAIVCDPPYGVRARSQKIGIRDSKKAKPKKEGTRQEEEPHYAQKEHFDFCELHDHLLHVAGLLLRPGGLLVFLFHTDDEQPAEKNKFPEHPKLEFIRSSRDQLTRFRARHLITMRRRKQEVAPVQAE